MYPKFNIALFLGSFVLILVGICMINLSSAQSDDCPPKISVKEIDKIDFWVPHEYGTIHVGRQTIGKQNYLIFSYRCIWKKEDSQKIIKTMKDIDIPCLKRKIHYTD